MALVCDSKSTPSSEDPPQKTQEEIDLEDGEIEDDDEEDEAPPPPQQPQEVQELPQDLQNGPSPTKSEKSDKGEKSGKKLEPDLPNVVLSPSHSEKSLKKGSKDKDSSKEKSRRASKREEKKVRKELEKAAAGHRHMTEAEKSILHLRKKEKLLREREKWHKKDPAEALDDDFAKNIEKTLATILHKKEKEMAALNSGNEDEVKEEKRGKKRRKHDKDRERHKAKHKRNNMESPRSEFDENEMLNVRSGSPGGVQPPFIDPVGPLGGPAHNHKRSRSPSSESYDDEDFGADDREERPPRRRFNKDRDNTRGGRDNARDRNWRNNKKDGRNDRNNARNNNKRDRDMRRQHENSPQQNKMDLLQDSQGVCVFYMQGKCQKSDCPYSHEVSPPMKLELCKFYLMDCCAKGENCSYMHGEFPCKFYHTGLQCMQGDDCKFAHGASLTEGLKQILFKHIETAPRDILQGFPRLSREEALNLINITQKKLQDEYTNEGGGGQAEGGGEVDPQDLLKGGIPSLFDLNVPVPPELAQNLDSEIKLPPSIKKQDKKPKVTRWHQKDNAGFPSQFSYGTDLDMRICSNGDVDMRTLPTLSASNSLTSLHSNTSAEGALVDAMDYKNDVSVTVSPSTKDIDIRQNPGLLNFGQDIDSRQPISFSIKAARDVDIRNQLLTKDLETNRVFQNNLEVDEVSRTSPSDKSEDKKPEGDSNQSQYVPNISLSQSTMDLLARIKANNPSDLNSIPVPQTDYQPASSLIVDEQQQQKVVNQQHDDSVDNINWYSDEDDDDEPRLTIKVEDEETRRDSISKDDDTKEDEEKEESNSEPFTMKPTDIVGKLGDLSKIDISAEVTKLLTSIKESKFSTTTATSSQMDKMGGSPKPESPSTSKETFMTDPRMALRQERRRDSSSSQEGASPRAVERRQSRDLTDPRTYRENKDTRKDPRGSKDPRDSKEALKDKKDPRLGVVEDPRGRRKTSVDEKKTEKMSIYEQGGLDMQAALNEIENEDFKGALRPDIDLRNLALPFKGMQNYTPATEIDASLNSHPPIPWKVVTVDIPRPDYTGLKLSINDAEKTGDPRLRKLFRLSVDEKESPMSPKASPKGSMGVRVDPRLRKVEEKPSSTQVGESPQQMPYNQQLTILQSSQFYQSLTSNQKLMLNQELSDRYTNEQNAGTDHFLYSLLSNLNLLPGGPSMSNVATVQSLTAALLPNIPPSALPMLAAQQAGLNLGQQGLLGVAPGIPNMPVDFPMNFDPRNGGLLGNGPPMFSNHHHQGGGGNYFPMDGEGGYNNDDFYPGNDGHMNHRGGGNFRGGHQHHNRNMSSNNRDSNRRRGGGGGRHNFNNNNRQNRDFKNNRGGDRGGRHNRQNNRHQSPD